MLTIETKPFLLYETLAMIFRYVNQIPICKTRENIRTNRLPDDHILYRRMNRLQEIMNECCAGLDTDNALVQRCFRRIETGCASEYTCLAYMMTMAFLQHRHNDLDQEAQALKSHWETLQQEGYEMEVFGANGLEFGSVPPGEEARDMWDQIYGLKCAPEVRLEIGHFLLHYAANLDRLVELIRPYAVKLEALYQKESWIMDSAVEYWQQLTRSVTVEEILIRGGFVPETFPTMPERRLCLNLMNHDTITYAYWENEPQNALFIFGCSLTADMMMKSQYSEPAVIGEVLHSISEKNKFEILRRLSGEPSYCQKLAEEMGCHTGNLSRYLGALWKEGFLIRWEENARVYYKTDKENLEIFLRDVQTALFG